MTGYDGEEIEPDRKLNELEHAGARYQKAIENGLKEDNDD